MFKASTAAFCFQTVMWFLLLMSLFTLVQGYAFVPEGDEEALKEAVYSRGPIAVSLDASHRSFRFYSHGRHAHLLVPTSLQILLPW